MSTITSSSNCQWQEFCGIDEVLMLLSQFPATLRLRCLAGIRAAVAGGQNYTPSPAAVSVFFLLFVDGSLRPSCRGKAIPTGKLLQRSEAAFDSNHGVNTRSFLGRLRTIRKLPAGPSPQAAVK